MSKKTIAWLILTGSILLGAGGVISNWDGSNWQLLIGGLMSSIGGVVLASFSKGVNQLINGNGVTSSHSDPKPVQPQVRR